MSYTIRKEYRRAVKASEKTGETIPGSLKLFALMRAPESKSAASWLKAKAEHRPRKLHRAAVKKAKAEGRRAFTRKSSAARRAAKAKVAK